MKTVHDIDLADRRGTGNVACFSPDGTLVAGGGGTAYSSSPCRILLWKLPSAEPIGQLDLEKRPVCGLRFSPDGRMLATAYNSGSEVDLWRTPSLKKAGVLRLIPVNAPPLPSGLPHDRTKVGDLTFSPDGRWMAAGCWDLRVKRWDLRGNAALDELAPEHRENVDFVAFGDGQTLYSGTANALWKWQLQPPKLLHAAQVRGPEIWIHALSLDRQHLVSVGHKGTIRTWNREKWTYKKDKLNVKRSPNCLAWSPNNKHLAIGCEDGWMLFWDVTTRSEIGRRKLSGTIGSLNYAPDGASIVTVHIDKPGKSMTTIWKIAD